MASGWLQLAEEVSDPGLPGVRVEGDTLVFDGAEADDALYEWADQAIAGAFQDGADVIGPRWILTDTAVPDEVPGARRIGSVYGVHREPIEWMAPSPDGTTLAVGISDGWRCTVALWDTATRTVRHRWMARAGDSLGYERCGTWGAFGGDGTVVTGGRDRWIRVFDPGSGRIVRRRELDDVIRASAAGGSWIAAHLHRQDEILVLDPALEVVQRVRAYTPPRALRIVGDRLLVVTRDGFDLVRLDTSDRRSVYGTFDAAHLLPDGRVATLGEGELRLYDGDTLLHTIAADGEALAVSPDATRFAIGGADGVTVFGATGEVRSRVGRPAGALAWTADGTLAIGRGRRLVWGADGGGSPLDGGAVAVTGSGAVVPVGDGLGWLAGWASVQPLPGLGGEVTVRGDVAVSLTDGELRYVGLDGTPLGAAAARGGYGATLAGDGRTALVRHSDGIDVVGAGTGLARGALAGYPLALAVAVADRAAVLVDRDGARWVEVLRSSDGEVLGRWVVTEVQHLAIADDGRLVIAYGDQILAIVPDVPEIRWTVPLWAGAVAIAPSNDQIAVGHGVDVVWLDAGDGSVRERRPAHPHGVSSLAAADDGSFVSVGGEGTALLWAPRTGAGTRSPVGSVREVLAALLASGPAEREAAADADRAAGSAPWTEVPVDPGQSGPLPSRAGPPFVVPTEGRVRGRLSFAGPAEAGIGVADGSDLVVDEPFDGDLAPLEALAARAVAGSLTVTRPGRVLTTVLVARAGVDEVWPDRPPGVLARFGRRTAPREPWGVVFRGADRTWLVEPYTGDDDEDDGYQEHPSVCTVRVVDTVSGEVLASQHLPFEPELRVSPDGRRATFQASETFRHLARMADARDTVGLLILDDRIDERGTIRPDGPIRGIEQVVWAPDGSRIALRVETVDYHRRIELWDPHTLSLLAIVEGDRPLMVAPHAAVWIGAHEGVSGVWRADDDGVVQIAAEADELFAVDGGFAITTGGEVTVFDPSGTERERYAVPGRGRPSADPGLWEDGDQRWRLADGVPVHDHLGSVVAAALAGDRLATFDGQVLIVRQPSDGRVLVRVALDMPWDWREHGVPSLHWFADRLVVVANDRVDGFDLVAGTRFGGAPSALVGAAAVGRELVTVHRYGRLRRWDPASGICLSEEELPAGVRRVAFGDRRAVATDDAVLFGEGVHPVGADRDLAIAISADGTRLVVCNSSARLYDGEGALVAELADYGARTALFVPDGRLFVAIGDRIAIFDPTSGARIGELGGHDGSIEGLALDDTGERLVSYGSGVLVWDLAQGSSSV